MGEKKPEIRFQGYNDEWEEKELGELGSVAMNKRIFKHQTFISGEIPFFKIGTFGKKPDAFITRELFDEYKKKYPYPEIGDLLLSASGSIGKVVEYSGADEYFQDSNIVWLKHDETLNKTFLKQYYAIVRWHGLEGSTIKRLYNKNILETKISLPIDKEQAQIGTFFQKIDTLIVLRQKKLDKLKNTKKAFLNKMFPKEGSDVPEIRFEGFSGKWERRTLGEVCEEFKSGKYIKSENIKEKGDYPVYGGNGFRGYSDLYNHDGLYALIGRQGALCGNVNISTGKAYFTEHAIAVRANETNDTNFLFYLLDTMNLGQYSGQSAQPGLAVNKLIRLSNTIPKIQEQTKIGQFFQTLDRLIGLQEKEIEKLKNLKKAFLEKMFV